MADTWVCPIDEVEAADVVVIGSGMAGVCAAIQAGRLGCSVILLEKDETLGGNSSPNLGVHISGAHSFHPYASETGIIGEIEEEAAHWRAKIITHSQHYNIARQWDSLLQWMMEEAAVRVRKRHYAKAPVMEGRCIRSIIVEDTGTYKTKRVDVGVCVIDASGDGHVAAQAGASFRIGREARAEFNERTAPEQADAVTMGTSVTALVRKASHPVEFIPPKGTPPFIPGYGYGRDSIPENPKECLYAHSSWNPEAEFCFLWHTETGGEQDTIEDDHEICDRLLGHLYSAWNHIKNEAHQEEAKNWELIWVSPKAGKRESRRFEGDYILTQTDVEGARAFEDAVAYGGYAVDLHDPVGDQVKIIFHSLPPLYSIPYRSLYSKDIDNLFLAGRLISVTRMALGTVRLQKTLGATGQAVGAAASLCKRHKMSPREISQSHMHGLQQLLLKEDATILGVPNKDPNDLARSAHTTSTSERRFECVQATNFLPMDRPRGLMLWDWGQEIQKVECYLRNETDVPVPMELVLRLYRAPQKWKANHRIPKPEHITGQGNRMEWGSDTTINRFEPVASARVTVPPHFEGWVTFAFSPSVSLIPKDPTSDEERYAVLLSPAQGISWARHACSYDIVVRCWADPGATAYHTAAESHLFKITPRPPYGEASNTINGYNRRFCTNPVNMWMADPELPLPQTLTLEWDTLQRFQTVHLTFDTLYRAYREMPFNDNQEVSGMCVRDYGLEVWTDGAWHTLVSETKNYRRFRIHTFDPVRTNKMRLVVKAMNDPQWNARVYEVRVYGEYIDSS